MTNVSKFACHPVTIRFSSSLHHPEIRSSLRVENWLQGCYRDLRWAVEAEGDAYGSDAAVHVKLEPSELVVAFGEDASVGRQSKRPEAGDADLAAVGVAAEHEIDMGAATMAGDLKRVVGFVDHEDDGGVGLLGDGLGHVG